MDLSILDDVLRIDDALSFEMTRKLARQEGVFTGGSGGAAVWGAVEYARRNNLSEDKVVVALICDTGARYLSKIYNDEWMREHGFLPNDREGTAAELLNTKDQHLPALISLEPESLAFEALRIMRDHGVDQIPVISAGKVMGTVREDQIFELFMSKADPQKVNVSSIMTSPLPEVDETASIEEVSRMLAHETKAVLVRRGSGQRGIVTKADLIARINR